MSFLNAFNKPRLLMFDATDYGYGGFIGFPSGSAALVPVKDISGSIPPTNEYHTWEDVYNTYRATRDGSYNAVRDYILSSVACYNVNYDNDDGIGRSDHTPITNKEDVANAADDVFLKFLLHFEKGLIFWNTLRPVEQKNTGIQTISSFKKITLARNRWTVENWDTPPPVEPPKELYSNTFDMEPYPITIDYDQCQTLTSQIYEEYLNSLREYMFALKVFMKIITGSTFNRVDPPFDWNIPFIPPYTP